MPGERALDSTSRSQRPYPLNLNRDWYEGPEERPPYLVGPRADETKAWYACFCKIQPHYFLDLHHMGVGLVSGTNEVCSLELGISLLPDRFTIPDDPDPLYDGRTFKDMVRQLQGHIYDNIIDYGGVLSATMITLLPILLFFLLFRTRIIAGISTTGMKY